MIVEHFQCSVDDPFRSHPFGVVYTTHSSSAFSGTVDIVDIYIDLDIDNIDHSHN
jgi:hypothetical protein